MLLQNIKYNDLDTLKKLLVGQTIVNINKMAVFRDIFDIINQTDCTTLMSETKTFFENTNHYNVKKDGIGWLISQK